MLTRIKPRLVADLARRDIPGPVDVVNLISTDPKRFSSYRWYGLLVMPALLLAGGRVQWMSRFERSLSGEQQADKLLLVRYPSHRRFLLMTLNPYYIAINRLREAGVRRFEASFTKASRSEPKLMSHRQLIGVHFVSREGRDGLATLEELMSSAGCRLVYATRAVASLEILDPPRDTDPNPLSFGELAMFAPGDSELPDDDLPDLTTRIEELTEHCAVAVAIYRRESPQAYRPSFRSGPQVASEPA